MGAKKKGRRNDKRWCDERGREEDARHKDCGRNEGRSDDSTISPNDKAKGNGGAGEEEGHSGRDGGNCERGGRERSVPGYVPTPEELCLREVYGDWARGNLSTHLNRGVKEDGLWQGWWRDPVVMPPCQYEAPIGEVGRRFVNALMG